ASFRTTTHAKTLTDATNLDEAILGALRTLFDTRRDRRQRVRLLGVALSHFSRGSKQLNLLDAARREKLEKLCKATDKLRDRFGFGKVQYGGSLGASTEREPGEEG